MEGEAEEGARRRSKTYGKERQETVGALEALDLPILAFEEGLGSATEAEGDLMIAVESRMAVDCMDSSL